MEAGHQQCDKGTFGTDGSAYKETELHGVLAVFGVVQTDYSSVLRASASSEHE